MSGISKRTRIRAKKGFNGFNENSHPKARCFRVAVLQCLTEIINYALGKR